MGTNKQHISHHPKQNRNSSCQNAKATTKSAHVTGLPKSDYYKFMLALGMQFEKETEINRFWGWEGEHATQQTKECQKRSCFTW